jgi:acyl-CoA-binding protein
MAPTSPPSSSSDEAGADLLRARFDAASDFFEQLVSSDPKRVPDSAKLRCYGLYKQATAGDAPLRTASSGSGSSGVPPWWRPWWGAAASKWRAWSSVRGTPADRAMELYVEEVRRAAPEWGDTAAAAAAAARGRGQAPSSRGGPGGAVFSRPQGDDVGDDDHEGEGSATILHELAGKGDERAIVAHLDALARRAGGGGEAGGAAGAGGSTDGTTPSSSAAVLAAVNAPDPDGASPLHFAADRGHAHIARLLCRAYGADVRMADADGATALHYAAAGGHASCCEALLRECGADGSAVDAEGKTARDLAPAGWGFWEEG